MGTGGRRVAAAVVAAILLIGVGVGIGLVIPGPVAQVTGVATPEAQGPVAGGSTPAVPATSVPTRAPVATATQTPVPTPTPTNTPAATPTATPTPTPTNTPSPTPTPTPRIKPPPSAYKRLQDYPRPAGDSGYGFHINASPYPPDNEIMVYQVIPLLKDLGATWVTVWVADDNQVDRIKPLIDNGFEVVLRYHSQGSPPHPNYVPLQYQIEKYVKIGVHYFVTGNEPNLSNENQGAGPDEIARQWMMSADVVKFAGGIPLLYPMSPGGDLISHRAMLIGILEWLKKNDALDTLDGAGIAIHNRPHNKPLDLRNDDTAFLEYEWIDDLVKSYIGRSIPLIATEAGYTVGEARDPRFPRITEDTHRILNMEIIFGFRDGRWRDSLFAQNFWILGQFGYPDFLADPWVFNPLYHGKDLPIVEQLKATPKFVRKFNEPGFVTKPR